MKRILGLFVVLAMAIGLSAEEKGAAVEGGTRTKVTFTQSYDSVFEIIGHASDGWSILSSRMIKVGTGGVWIPFNDSSTTHGLGMIDDYKRAPELFTAILNGEIIKKGPGEKGEIPQYTIQGGCDLYRI